jgi:hypothetical protein
VPVSALRLLKFYNAATLVFDGGTGERHSLLRGSELDDDQCLVFEDKDGCFLYRIEDFSRDENGDAWVHGARLYSAAQLPTETQAELPDDFDRSSELVESVNRGMESLLEVKSVTRVTLVTSVRGAKDKYRAGRVYVDDKPEDRAWALTSEKSRDDPLLTNNNNNTRQLRRQRRRP